jgi:glycosyltransferase involved in cell wall biosynthesis
MKHLRICFAESSAFFGGSNISTIDIINHIAMLNENIELYYVVQQETPSIEYAMKKLDNKNVFSLGRGGIIGIYDIFKLPKYMFNAWRFIRKNKINVVHCTNETLMWWLLPCLFSTANPVWNIRSELSNSIKARIRKTVYFIFCKNIIGVSNAVLKPLVSDKKKKICNVETIRNFVPRRLLQISATPSNKTNNHACIIGFVGRLDDSVKNPERAIAIFLEVLNSIETKTELHFWGYVSHETKAKLKSLIPIEVSNRFVFHGKNDDINHIYSNLDILLLTSRSEGSPRVIMESAMFCVPSVATEVGGVPELIKDSDSGFLFSTNKEAVAAISKLVESESLRENMGMNAKKHFLDNMSWQLVVKKYIEFYQKAI